MLAQERMFPFLTCQADLFAHRHRLVVSASTSQSSHGPLQAGEGSRRRLMLLGGAMAGAWMSPSDAIAGLLPSFLSQQGPLVADAVRFPRNKLDLRFAVLMMHSVYEAVDNLNIVPTATFQSTFWKRRRDEYEPYLQQYVPLQVRQGDLTDPLYFDFISFAQLSTVWEDIIKAAPSYQRQEIALTIQNRIGDLIFEGMRDGFREEIFNGPSELPAGAHLDKLTEGVQSILDIFVQKGFALKASVNDISAECKEGSCEYHGALGGRGKFTIRIEGPADLWGMNTAGMRSYKLQPDFIAYAVDGFLRASKAGASHSASSAPAAITQKWLIA